MPSPKHVIDNFLDTLEWKSEEDNERLEELKCEYFHIIESFLEMYGSLIDAVREAGGTPDVFNYNALKDMTAHDLICALCTNGIRFQSFAKEREKIVKFANDVKETKEMFDRFKENENRQR